MIQHFLPKAGVSVELWRGGTQHMHIWLTKMHHSPGGQSSLLSQPENKFPVFMVPILKAKDINRNFT